MDRTLDQWRMPELLNLKSKPVENLIIFTAKVKVEQEETAAGFQEVKVNAFLIQNYKTIGYR